MLEKLNLPENFTQALGKGDMQARKVSPQVLLGVGIVGFVGTVVLACRASMKLEGVVTEAEELLEGIEETRGDEDFSDEELDRAKYMVYGRTAMNLARLYAPAVGLGLLSVGCIAGSHHVLNTRVAGLSAAYAGLDKAYKRYQERVAAEYGEEKARLFRTDNETVVTTDENGKKLKLDVPAKNTNPYGLSIYARWFDEGNLNFQRDREYNLTFLSAQQAFFNNKLRADGVVLLNDVYKALGYDRTREGALVGWSLTGDGDGFIDFGFTGSEARQRAFVNLQEPNILLDFNVEGVVIEKF